MSYTDSNTSQLAYAIDAATKLDDLTATELKPINILNDNLKPTISAKTSDDIRDDGQYSTARTMGGSAGGAVNMNFRYGEYDDFLRAAFRNDWVEDTADATGKTHVLWNGLEKVPFFFERKLKRLDDAGNEWNDFRRFFCQYLSTATLNLPSEDWVSLNTNFLGLGFEYAEADASVDPKAGEIAGITYAVRGNSDPIDSSNSIPSLIVKDENGVSMDLVLEQGSVEFNSNLREDKAVGHRFSANIGFGRFGCMLNGTFYFRNQGVLDAMWNDKNLSVEITFSVNGNSYTLVMPAVRVMQNDEDVPQVDTTMRSPVQMQAFPKTVTVAGEQVNCTAYLVRVAA